MTGSAAVIASAHNRIAAGPGVLTMDGQIHFGATSGSV